MGDYKVQGLLTNAPEIWTNVYHLIEEPVAVFIGTLPCASFNFIENIFPANFDQFPRNFQTFSGIFGTKTFVMSALTFSDPSQGICVLIGTPVNQIFTCSMR